MQIITRSRSKDAHPFLEKGRELLPYALSSLPIYLLSILSVIECLVRRDNQLLALNTAILCVVFSLNAFDLIIWYCNVLTQNDLLKSIVQFALQTLTIYLLIERFVRSDGSPDICFVFLSIYALEFEYHKNWKTKKYCWHKYHIHFLLFVSLIRILIPTYSLISWCELSFILIQQPILHIYIQINFPKQIVTNNNTTEPHFYQKDQQRNSFELYQSMASGQVKRKLSKQQRSVQVLHSKFRNLNDHTPNIEAKQPEYLNDQLLNLIPFGIVILDQQCHHVMHNYKSNYCLGGSSGDILLYKLQTLFANPTNLSKITNISSQRICQSSRNRKSQEALIPSKRVIDQIQFNLDQAQQYSPAIMLNLINQLKERQIRTIEQSSDQLCCVKLSTKIEANQKGQKNKVIQVKVYDHGHYFLIIMEDKTKKEEVKQLNEKFQFHHFLLNSFSHELRTPLNGSLQLQEALLPHISESLANDYLSPAIVANKRLLHQINDILDYAQLEGDNFSLKIQEFKLIMLIETIKEYFERECQQKRISFILLIQEEIKEISFQNDIERILQILVNLINNSLKFTKEAGFIKISLKLVRQGLVQVSVEDNGVGIEFNKLKTIQQIIKAGETQNYDENTFKFVGLGLKICSNIARKLCTQGQGILSVTSEQGLFACVNFLIENIQVSRGYKQDQDYNLNQEINFGLEVKECGSQIIREKKISFIQQQKQPQSEEIPSPQPCPQAKTVPTTFNFLQTFQDKHSQTKQKEKRCKCPQILIVDDVPFNHFALCQLLKNFQLVADSAYSGDQAIQKVKERAVQIKKGLCTCQNPYRLILMDIEMPQKDGFQTQLEILDFLKKENLYTNTVMCSAYDSKENIEMANRCGMVDILSKPVNIASLKLIISQLLQ